VKKNELDTALGYFENNAPRMRLPLVPPVRPVHRLRRRRGQLQDRHRPKTQAIRHALDASGADAIIALRCREASSTWEAICNTPRTQTRTA